MHFRIHLSSAVKNLLETLTGIELNLEINLEETDIFMMLNLPSPNKAYLSFAMSFFNGFLVKFR